MQWFSRPELALAAKEHGLRYSWEGLVLGGLNSIATGDATFLAALDRLLTLETDGPVAVFCAEGDPSQCHRSWKVGAAAMVHRGVDPINILRDGREERVSRTLLRTKADNIPPCIRDEALRVALGRVTA
jgi:hypothetical protein